MILLSPFDLGLAAALVLALALLSGRLQAELRTQVLVAALRTAVQLLLIGLVLKWLFANARLWLVVALSLVMLAAAGREVTARQHRCLGGWWGFGVGTVSMFLSSFAVTLFALGVIIGNHPYHVSDRGGHRSRYAGQRQSDFPAVVRRTSAAATGPPARPLTGRAVWWIVLEGQGGSQRTGEAQIEGLM